MSDTRHNQPNPPERRQRSQADDAQLYAKYAEKLRRLVGATVSTSDANRDDACSFAWTQLIVTQPERGESIFGWLAKVALREAWRLHRSERRDLRDEDDVILDAIPGPSDAAGHAELDALGEALRTIHHRRRRMLLLYAAGFSCREIASVYGITEERARMLVYRARLQLRERCGRE
jgi:RNA polymerase sigma factor (sigma-70 family)